MDEFHQIVKLLELFTCPNNEIRVESENQYRCFEQKNPENAIRLLFEIISSNSSLISIQQALIRLRLLLQNYLSSTPIISLEIACQIKSFLINYIAQSNNSILAKYSLSMILDFYLKTFSNESMWEGFSQYLVDLYQIKPTLSLQSLTTIYDIYPNQEIASQIYAYMIFDQDTQLFVQSFVSGLILIKNRFKFDNFNQFISLLTKRLSSISDGELVEPLEAFHCAFLNFYAPFAPVLDDIFRYFLQIIADIGHLESIRVQCMYIFSDFVLNNADFRSIVLSNPHDLALTIAIAVSEPYQFNDIYKEAKKCLKLILDASMNDINVFDQSFEEFGSSENMYVKSIFLFYISSELSLNFAFENAFHEDQIIRHNSLKIIFNMIRPSQKAVDENSQKDNSIREQIEDKIADIFVGYFKEPNFEIYNFFKKWCECGGSDSLIKCIDPIIGLLQSKYDNGILYLIASLLCSRFLNLPIMQEIASNLLQYSKECINEQKEDQVFLEVVKNLLYNLDSESKTKLLNEILPNIFNSSFLTLSNDFIQIIEVLKKDFIPYLPCYLEVLFKWAFSFEAKYFNPIDSKIKSEADNLVVNSKEDIFFNDSDLKNLRYLLRSLDVIISNYPEICKSDETIFTNIIKIISTYMPFQYDVEIESEAVILCTDFVQQYCDESDFDSISCLIDPMIKAVKNTFDIENLSLFSSFTYFITKSKPEHVKYVCILLPLIFSQLNKSIQENNEKYQYFDGMELYNITEMLKDLENSFSLIFDIDIKSAISIFHQIIGIVPYFKLPNLDDKVKSFISTVWVYFVSFAPSEELPNPVPDLLNDLFEFFYNIYDSKIKESIISSIGTLVYNFIPQHSLSVLTEFEKIISNEEETIDVRQMACIQYAVLLIQCDQKTIESKIDNIIQMVALFSFKSENNGCFCLQLIDIIKQAIEQSFDPNVIQKVINIIKLFIDQELLYKDDFDDVISELKKMNIIK